LQVFFVLTGLGKTLGNQQMAYIGIDVGWILVNAVISTIGPVVIPMWFRGFEGLKPTARETKVAFGAGVLDALGILCSILGLKYAGSGLQSVIYASLPACEPL
jgi:drug/metabolite transporter (DMT)-like permease